KGSAKHNRKARQIYVHAKVAIKNKPDAEYNDAEDKSQKILMSVLPE
ncbi:MAG: hypothetical protein HQK67_10985, partial [Desulfamplus sp.]|nr:hypothetical protein [Desulfamplus sp.]